MQPVRLPENYYYGGGAADTYLSMPALCLFLLCALLVLAVPRRYVIAPFLVAAILIPLGNVVVVAGLHWMLLRCLLLLGWVRVLWIRLVVNDKRRLGRLNSLDKALILWAISNAVFYAINWGTMAALTNRLGFLYTTLGGFLLLRFLVRDRNDVMLVIRVLALICLLVAPFMIVERVTGANLYSSIFGGGSAISSIRDGKIRAQGPFDHPIIAGTVGAMLLPLFIGLWQNGRRYHLWAGLGVASAMTMAFTSNSSTSVLTAFAGIGALSLWPFRRNMRLICWSVVGVLVTLQIVMKADVWFLINRIGSLTGGSSWHRAQLVDQFIRHVGDWWLVGTQNNAYWGIDMWDVDNAYVSAAFSGGLVTFVLFVAVLIYGYKTVGKARRMAVQYPKTERFIWALGATLFANTVAFFGVLYFDQSSTIWYTFLAAINAVAMSAKMDFGLLGAPVEPIMEEESRALVLSQRIG